MMSSVRLEGIGYREHLYSFFFLTLRSSLGGKKEMGKEGTSALTQAH